MISRIRWPLLELELRWAYRDAIRKKHVGAWGYSPHTSAWLVLKGWSRIERKDGAAEAGPGEWLIAPPGERLQLASDDCKHLSIAFVARWAFGRELFPFACPLVLPGAEVPALRRLGLPLAVETARRFPGSRHELPESSGPLHAHLHVAAGFYRWFEVLCTALQNRGILPELMEIDPRVEEAVKTLNQARTRMPGPAELAGQAGLSASQLNRLFRKNLGITVREYCQRRKLAAARSLLSASGSRVKEIAFQLGFLSSPHFSRWFHLSTGMTPSEWQVRGDSLL